MTLRTFIPYVVFIGLSLLIGYLGSSVTMEAIPQWYATLAKPSWTPPNWVFGPVWTTLYVLMGAAAALVWNSRRLGRTIVCYLFVAHLLLNLAWSYVFFGLQSPSLGLLTILMLWVSILVLTIGYLRYSKVAAYLMLPYLAWVTYASTLNLGIFLMNP